MSSDQRPLRGHLAQLGWVSLLVSLTVPFLMSLYASYAFRTMSGSCDEEWRWGFAPLIATCGAPSPLAAILGWSATAITATAFALSVYCCAAALVSARSLPAKQRRDSVVAGLSLGIVVVTVVAIAFSDAALLNGSGLWIWFAATTGLLIAAVLLVLGGLIRLIK